MANIGEVEQFYHPVCTVESCPDLQEWLAQPERTIGFYPDQWCPSLRFNTFKEDIVLYMKEWVSRGHYSQGILINYPRFFKHGKFTYRLPSQQITPEAEMGDFIVILKEDRSGVIASHELRGFCDKYRFFSEKRGLYFQEDLHTNKEVSRGLPKSHYILTVNYKGEPTEFSWWYQVSRHSSEKDRFIVPLTEKQARYLHYKG